MRCQLIGPLTAVLVIAVTAGTACRPTAPPVPDPHALDPIARRYVVLGLNLGRSDPNYVDAYYGPDSLKAAAFAESLSVAQARTAAESLIAILGCRPTPIRWSGCGTAISGSSSARWSRGPGC